MASHAVVGDVAEIGTFDNVYGDGSIQARIGTMLYLSPS
ncbi:hypothetical protein ACPOL_4227 [Acidisarcina polymorpha]|uniref:Uncharacterized protein n=1 Tax=Acidisarcina polymorpha TaxID=2211140 RepID=A0A2Z5G3X4_9BACT|nr:hypothetical protein ACPOL_4227 [Acidisarcina polymorpha]